MIRSEVADGLGEGLCCRLHDRKQQTEPAADYNWPNAGRGPIETTKHAHEHVVIDGIIPEGGLANGAIDAPGGVVASPGAQEIASEPLKGIHEHHASSESTPPNALAAFLLPVNDLAIQIKGSCLGPLTFASD
jgi:hypothetical protein